MEESYGLDDGEGLTHNRTQQQVASEVMFDVRRNPLWEEVEEACCHTAGGAVLAALGYGLSLKLELEMDLVVRLEMNYCYLLSVIHLVSTL